MTGLATAIYENTGSPLTSEGLDAVRARIGSQLRGAEKLGLQGGFLDRYTPGCVGCGVCGDVSHAAQLCPSFAKIDIVQNPGWIDRFREKWETKIITYLSKGVKA